ncbi:hypothetical protein [Vibrio sp. SCSIO 43155]|uniref:hypothetical protein n=1 Tax=Vibrio TaxID=662 RepID=UPI002075247D|nr:hypothetical protein [Vibrio sp. SCSIO 43155]USD58610.1 hypothetical protein J4N44_27035 [Vibrio sp. SCSIO 43155]
MKIFTDDVGTKELRFGNRAQHSITWSSRNPEAVIFFMASSDVTVSTALSVDGIRVLKDSDNASVRFSNPSKQFMQQATLPKKVADVLCAELKLKYENTDLSE